MGNMTVIEKCNHMLVILIIVSCLMPAYLLPRLMKTRPVGEVKLRQIEAAKGGSYVVDSNQELGRRYDGIGGLSGGGATSKLLVNYEEPYRSQILDYLFKPNFGASLQILKVEIGGDGQSTDGTESSHMHEPWDEAYDRGYEWWLMVQAKKRNPLIKLYGLPWAFPGWVAAGTQNPYTKPGVTADYIVRWVHGAKKYYNLTIDYVGIWNERTYNGVYIKKLRSVLDSRGFQQTRIVAADNAWFISAAILHDKKLAKAVSIIGAHYPGTNSSKIALMTNKPLWASEDYSTYNNNVGAGCWARILNQNYVNGLMTSTISWNLIASYYENLPFGRDGLMTAQEPWSGHYTVESPIWVTAHTSWFSSIGWYYLGHGSGVGHLDHGGSYVTLVDRDSQHFTIIIETMSHDHSKCIRPGLPAYQVNPQKAIFTLQGTMAKVIQLYVWHSKLHYDGTPDKLFTELTPVKVVAGQVRLQLDIDELYTLTTVKRDPPKLYPLSPASKTFPIPYGDDFEGYPVNSEAYNFVPQVGVWEIKPAFKPHFKGGIKVKGQAQVNRQVMLHDGCYWCNPGPAPINIGGNYNWSDIFIQLDVYIPSTNGSRGVFLGARVTGGGCNMSGARGVFFTIMIGSDKYNIYTDYKMTRSINEGKLNQTIKPDTWYHIGLVVSKNEAYGFFEVDQIFQVKIPSAPAVPNHGFAAYGAMSYGLADYDNLMILDSSSVQNSKPKDLKNLLNKHLR